MAILQRLRENQRYQAQDYDEPDVERNPPGLNSRVRRALARDRERARLSNWRGDRNEEIEDNTLGVWVREFGVGLWAGFIFEFYAVIMMWFWNWPARTRSGILVGYIIKFIMRATYFSPQTESKTTTQA